MQQTPQWCATSAKPQLNGSQCVTVTKYSPLLQSSPPHSATARQVTMPGIAMPPSFQRIRLPPQGKETHNALAQQGFWEGRTPKCSC